jgi:metallo-beta-lactamase family protein
LTNLRVGESVDDSEAINHIHGGAIIVAGSPMATSDRVRHHLANNLAFARNHVIFVGSRLPARWDALLVNGVPRVHLYLFGGEMTARAYPHRRRPLRARGPAVPAGLVRWRPQASAGGAGAWRGPAARGAGRDAGAVFRDCGDAVAAGHAA